MEAGHQGSVVMPYTLSFQGDRVNIGSAAAVDSIQKQCSLREGDLPGEAVYHLQVQMQEAAVRIQPYHRTDQDNCRTILIGRVCSTCHESSEACFGMTLDLGCGPSIENCRLLARDPVHNRSELSSQVEADDHSEVMVPSTVEDSYHSYQHREYLVLGMACVRIHPPNHLDMDSCLADGKMKADAASPNART